MAISVLDESGSSLDQRIAKLLEGRQAATEVPRYSTDENAADAIMSRVAKEGLTPTFEQQDGKWYCVLWVARPKDEAKERIATGSAPTRPLAICRAFLNLPLRGSGRSLHLRTATRGWIADLSEAGTGTSARAADTHGPASSNDDLGESSDRATRDRKAG